MADVTQSTRALLSNLFASIEEEGMGTTFLNTLSDDVIWHATGNSPVAGVYHGKRAYLDKVLNVLHQRLATSARPKLHRMIVEGEWASIHFESKNVWGKNGADFSMEYVWLIRVVGQCIVEVVGFYDQKKMHDLFA